MEEKSTYVISSPQGELEEVVEEEQYKVMSKKRSSTMENPPHGKSNSKSSKQPKTENQASKKRKMIEKTVVTVRIEANVGTQKNEGPPSDFWSWRKYGQKPIKGSPYPRGYYRCSTSKGCSAKKQVERCRTDASILIVTYTSNHNHPGPDIHNTNQINQETSSSPRSQSTSDDQEELPNTPKEEPPASFISKDHHDQELTSSHEDHHHFHYFQYSDPLDDMIHLQGENPLTIDKTHDSSSLLLEEEHLSYPNLMTFSSSSSSSSSTPKSEENDFFDELEELPTFSNFKSFMRNTFFDERILVFPS